MVEEVEYPIYVEDPLDAEMQEEEDLEDQTDKQHEAYEDTSPLYKEKEDLYSLFKWIIGKVDSSKIGNVDKTELGLLNISVRDAKKIAILARTLGHNGFADFFENQAELILATSLSKDGFLDNLFVTTQKKSAKSRNIVSNLPQLQPKKKKRFFG